MAERKQRIVPEKYRTPGWDKCVQHGQPAVFLTAGDVKDYIVTTGVSTSGEAFTDAELRYLIAEIELAKERACEKADEKLAMLREILGDEPPKKAGPPMDPVNTEAFGRLTAGWNDTAVRHVGMIARLVTDPTNVGKAHNHITCLVKRAVIVVAAAAASTPAGLDYLETVVKNMERLDPAGNAKE